MSQPTIVGPIAGIEEAYGTKLFQRQRENDRLTDIGLALLGPMRAAPDQGRESEFMGAHADALAPSLDEADAVVFLHRPELARDAGKVVAGLHGEGVAAADADALIAALRERGGHVVFMSNGDFDGAPRRFFAVSQAG